MTEIVLNPGGGPYVIDDVEALLASLGPDEEPLIDVGGGMVIPLRELADLAGEETGE